MKVPLSFIKEYLDITQTPEEIAEVLTNAGIEVEKIESFGSSYSGVVVGYVAKTAPHPHADRLTVATVTDGNEEFQVVCGASNCRAGINVAFAKIGASLQDAEGKTFKIKKSTLRNVESFGMLCSSDELQIGTSSGIVELPASYAVGTPLDTYYSDTIFDISLTPNLGHCLSILGIARELAAHLNLPLKQKSLSLTQTAPPIETLISVDLIDQRQCPRYACRAALNLKVAPSPAHLKTKIEKCGMRSINTIVDIGNLVMFELGQPLHMFDYDKIEGKKLLIASQTNHETLQTLDEIQRTVFPESLLICDEAKPLAFAGVIGGLSSAVTENTTNVLIEAAYFLPTSIRKTSKLLGIKSDSSVRFEKGIDPNGVTQALDYAAFLLSEFTGASIAKSAIDKKTQEFHEKKIHCHTKRVNQLLGTHLSTSEIATFLNRLSLTAQQEQLHSMVVKVPTYRHDISIEEDLIEEVARIYGYRNIDKELGKASISSAPHSSCYLMETKMRHKLLERGLQEFITCDLISPSQAQLGLGAGLSSNALIKVMHAYCEEQSVLRPTLLPGLLQLVKYNIDHGNSNLAGFELGRIHFKEKDLYLEPSTAAIILTGLSKPYYWDPKPKPVDFFDAKGIVEDLMESLQIQEVHFEVSHLAHFHPGRQAKIKIKSATLGIIAQIHPDITRPLGIDQPVFFVQLSVAEIMAMICDNTNVAEIPPFPGSERDWTVTVEEKTLISHLLQAIEKTPSRLLEKVLFLDLYKSEQIGKDKKNVTFRFFYRDKEKTIAFETVEKEHARIISNAKLVLE